MLKVASKVFALLTLFAIAGCGTSGGVKINDLDRALLDLQGIAEKSMPLGLRKTSPNGREFFSNYFVTEKRKFKPAEKLPHRMYAHILVLGDRRPYTMQIIVHKEKAATGRGASGFEDAGMDQGIAKVIRKRVVQQLTKRREDMNIIDDFRVF